ncbi:AAA family ATPase [Desulfomonile tiedjei]|uniref:CO dehydrogenase maturation factor n=1 Tax=Desulfomonile tiedjei (strain ATCC 49306 / DSM 6799 / DCB-1) TaxID=706587 RepID=I4C673_DESTA|nr:carbon monoxide dehydrogenase accessory protein CooC [Desulfomonile tiedjei]AFM25064.1 CO dehydrogenase maturation factor [Desulfomonile tiedjei DSM 6799]
MKIAVSGKGGVGKTTLSSLLARYWARNGYRVLAVDADPDANLGSALGIETAGIVPVAKMEDLITERTGLRPGTVGGFFKMNPKVDDLPEALGREKDGVRLLIMGTVKKGGGGCICPESVLLKALVSHLVLYEKDLVIMDMEAGIEHLGRGTAQGVNRLLIVVEPGRRSIETAAKVRELTKDIGLHKVAAVGSKVRNSEEEAFLHRSLDGIPLIGILPFSEEIARADLESRPPSLDDPQIHKAIAEIAAALESEAS